MGSEQFFQLGVLGCEAGVRASEQDIHKWKCLIACSHLERGVRELGILHCVQYLLRFFESVCRDRKCSGDFGEGMDTEDGASDDAERAKSARRKFLQIVAGDVFHYFAAAGSEGAVGKRQRHADDQFTQGPETKT